MSRLRKGRRRVGRKERPGAVAGSTFQEQPRPELGTRRALEVVAQHVSDGTLGAFAVSMGHQGRKEETKRCCCLSCICLLLQPARRVARTLLPLSTQ